jgi:hypothetical protein
MLIDKCSVERPASRPPLAKPIPGTSRLESKFDLHMWEVLKHALSGQNPLASGGLLLMFVGGLGVYLHAVPAACWDWFVRQTTMTITVKDDDDAFVWVKEWFLDQPFLLRVRRLDLDTALRGEKISLIPAPGRHWFWYQGRPFQVFFYRSQESKGWSPRRIPTRRPLATTSGDRPCRRLPARARPPERTRSMHRRMDRSRSGQRLTTND